MVVDVGRKWNLKTKEILNGISNKRDFKIYLKEKRYFKYKLKKLSQTKEI